MQAGVTRTDHESKKAHASAHPSMERPLHPHSRLAVHTNSCRPLGHSSACSCCVIHTRAKHRCLHVRPHLMRPRALALAHSLTHSHSLIHTHIYPRTHMRSNHPLTHPFTLHSHSRTFSRTHPCTYSLTRSLTHSLTHSPNHSHTRTRSVFSPLTDEDAVEEIDETEVSEHWSNSNPVKLSQRRSTLAPGELVELERQRRAGSSESIDAQQCTHKHIHSIAAQHSTH
jgi:hypothetical protein